MFQILNNNFLQKNAFAKLQTLRLFMQKHEFA